MNYKFSDVKGNQVSLTFDRQKFSANPGHVLIFPIYKNQIVMTIHKKRGLELPGGKVEKQESILMAAIREMWEETGAVLDGILRIGEYTIKQKNEVSITKTIFLAYVHHFEPLPPGFETGGYQLFPLSVEIEGSQFSPFIKDAVFQHTRQYVMSHNWHTR